MMGGLNISLVCPNITLHWDNQCVFVCFYLEPPCEAIEVTADPSNSHVGLYLLSDKKVSDNPVWKIQHGDRYIFNTGGASGWRIGSKSSLTSGSYYCHGKHILILFIRAMRVGSDTFGDPIFQKGLQN